MKQLIIKDKSHNYFFKDICKEYNVHEMFALRTDRKLYAFLSKRGIYIFGKWKRKIKKYNEIIIFESLYNSKVGKYIKRKNPNCRLILFFWNTIIDKTREEYLKDKSIDEFWTFDPVDAKKFNINLNSQFYTKKIKLSNHSPTIDLFFVGRDKGRKQELLDLENKFNSLGITSNIIIMKKRYDFLAYDKYLEILENSRAILDYAIKGQSGLTLRCMESLFLSKKLITNNSEIKKYDFYNPNNIFILGENNLDDLHNFINTPYKKIDSKIIEYYDIDNWIKRFDKKEEKYEK